MSNKVQNRSKFPQCFECRLTEELARCDIEDKTPCGLVICRRCKQQYADKPCYKEGCKKPYKKHTFRKNFFEKYRKQINIKFDNEFRIRSDWQSLLNNQQLDIDMVNILAALYNQNRQTYESHAKKQINGIVNKIRDKKNTILTHFEHRNLPTCVQIVQKVITPENAQYDGSQACGLKKLNYFKGIEQIMNYFEQ